MSARTVAIALLLAACGPTPREVTDVDVDVARVAIENNAFTLDAHRQLAAGGGNLFHSPFSMNAALSMTWAGASGVTAEEMAGVLHIPPDAPHHEPLGALMRDLDGDKRRAYTLQVANRIWAQDGLPWNAEFQAINAEDYGAPLVLQDIAANPDATRSEINSWVADVTRDKIPELLQPGAVDGLTPMVLVNAVYFKADWKHRFDKVDTVPRAFHREDGSTVDVETMNGTMPAALADGEGFTAGGLAYGDDAEVRMWILLPEEGSDLATLEASLDAEVLDTVLDGAIESREVHVLLPRLELRSRFSLREPLGAMGMPSAFDPATADFSALFDSSPQQQRTVYLEDVDHEAYVKIDEEGTEAAAATATRMSFTSATTPEEFTVDRPYLFLIRDELTGTVLFIGRVVDPSTATSG